MTSNRLFTLENPPVWINSNNAAKKCGPKFLHSNVKDSLPVIVNTWCTWLLKRVAQPAIRSRGDYFITWGRVDMANVFSLKK